MTEQLTNRARRVTEPEASPSTEEKDRMRQANRGKSFEQAEDDLITELGKAFSQLWITVT